MKFKERLAQLGFYSYAAYLQSEHWQAFKAAYRDAGKPMRCAVCGAGKIQLHHHDYSRLGSELLGDVDPLCREHHQAVHDLLRRRNASIADSSCVIDDLRASCLAARMGLRQSVPEKAKRQKVRHRSQADWRERKSPTIKHKKEKKTYRPLPQPKVNLGKGTPPPAIVVDAEQARAANREKMRRHRPPPPR